MASMPSRFSSSRIHIAIRSGLQSSPSTLIRTAWRAAKARPPKRRLGRGKPAGRAIGVLLGLPAGNRPPPPAAPPLGRLPAPSVLPLPIEEDRLGVAEAAPLAVVGGHHTGLLHPSV